MSLIKKAYASYISASREIAEFKWQIMFYKQSWGGARSNRYAFFCFCLFYYESMVSIQERSGREKGGQDRERTTSRKWTQVTQAAHRAIGAEDETLLSTW